MTNASLFPISTLARYFDIFLADNVGTVPGMTRRATLMTTVKTSSVTALLANITIFQTLFFLVTDFKALVTTANETLSAWKTARE